MHTEEDARKLWCPFARVSCSNQPVEGNHAPNRWASGEIPREANCIASECAAWRWARKPNPDYREGNIWPEQRPVHEREMYIKDTERGFCGLAGQP